MTDISNTWAVVIVLTTNHITTKLTNLKQDQRHKCHHLHLTLKMTTAQVVEMSVTNNSLSKDYPYPDYHAKIKIKKWSTEKSRSNIRAAIQPSPFRDGLDLILCFANKAQNCSCHRHSTRTESNSNPFVFIRLPLFGSHQPRSWTKDTGNKDGAPKSRDSSGSHGHLLVRNISDWLRISEESYS